jgi:methionine sulfoxide reductase heme-binding subunit
MHTNPSPYLFWITSRAAGFAALILASLAVSLGLLMSTKLLKRRGVDLRVTHEVLALSTIVAIVVHAVSLLGDSYLRPSIFDITIPFVSSYKSFWTSIGIVGGWGLIALGLAYYARRKIGAQRWRKLHRFTALAWLLGLAHALGEGTDAGQIWFLAMLAIVAIPALGLLATRLSGARPSERPRTGPALQPRRVALDEAGELAAALRPARTGFGQRDRVEAPARDLHPRVAVGRVNRDPAARARQAPALEAG